MVRTTATWACSGVLTLASRAAPPDSSVSMSRGGGREGLVLAGTGSERRHTGSSRGGRTVGAPRSVPREDRQRATGRPPGGGGRGRPPAGPRAWARGVGAAWALPGPSPEGIGSPRRILRVVVWVLNGPLQGPAASSRAV